MKVRRKIYEGLIAQCEALAAALHEEKSKRQLWTRKYYSLLLGIESARREADGGTDAATTRFGTEINGRSPKGACETRATEPAELIGVSRSDSHSAVMTALPCVGTDLASTPRMGSRLAYTSPFDSDGFYHSHGDCKSPEAFGLTPDWMVANAVSDAPSTASSNAELTTEPPAGCDGVLPSPPASSNALSRNSRGPLSSSLDTITNSAI
jgi:hypothetical protein